MLSESTNFRKNPTSGVVGAFSVDVEEWYHILESGAAPEIEEWGSLESRIEHNLNQILKLLDEQGIRGTFFWLGWLAERHRKLVTRCKQQGHEIASHGYAHLLPWEVGHKRFKNDIARSKKVLEDITGQQVLGFRTAGFGINNRTRWALEVISEVGYEYDSSITSSLLKRHTLCDNDIGACAIPTQNGQLIEVPMSTLRLSYLSIRFIGGGYLRLFPTWFMRWGISRVRKTGQPAIIYVHPREIDLDHPRLPVGPIKYFRCYFNLKSTMPKLKWLCENYSFCTMYELAENFKKSLDQVCI